MPPLSDMLKDKVAIVTGAGRGIGRSIALAMAAHGAKVVVNDLGTTIDGQGNDTTHAKQVVDGIIAAGGQAIANGESVSDFQSAGRIVESAVDNFGSIDIVVNNAGILRDSIFHHMTEDQWDAVINVHLKGGFNVSRHAATHFRKQESGCFLFLTSTSALIGNLGQANYAAAKLGIVGLSKSLALDMSRFNVRSNCISPFAWSRMIGSLPDQTPEERDRIEKNKQMTPDKIAPMAVYLTSDVARDVTGQVFAVRNNEIFLMGQSRPLRSVHRGEGWTPQTIQSHAIPALKKSFYDLDRTADVFTWDPI